MGASNLGGLSKSLVSSTLIGTSIGASLITIGVVSIGAVSLTVGKSLFTSIGCCTGVTETEGVDGFKLSAGIKAFGEFVTVTESTGLTVATIG